MDNEYYFIGNHKDGFHVGQKKLVDAGHAVSSWYCTPIHDSKLVVAQYADEYIEHTDDSRPLKDLIAMRASTIIELADIRLIIKDSRKQDGLLRKVPCQYCLSYIKAINDVNSVHG